MNSLSALRPASRFVNYNKNCSPFLDQEINRLSLVIVSYFWVTKILLKIFLENFWLQFFLSLPLCASCTSLGIRVPVCRFLGSLSKQRFKFAHLFAWNFGKTNLEFWTVYLLCIHINRELINTCSLVLFTTQVVGRRDLPCF